MAHRQLLRTGSSFSSSNVLRMLSQQRFHNIRRAPATFAPHTGLLHRAFPSTPLSFFAQRFTHTTPTLPPAGKAPQELCNTAKTVKEAIPKSEQQLVIPEGKFRKLWNKYGLVGVSTYAGLYVISWGAVFMAVRSGLDVVGIFRAIGADKIANLSQLNPNAGALAVSWFATKFTEPLRLVATLAITPPLSRFLMGTSRNIELMKAEQRTRDLAKQAEQGLVPVSTPTKTDSNISPGKQCPVATQQDSPPSSVDQHGEAVNDSDRKP